MCSSEAPTLRQSLSPSLFSNIPSINSTWLNYKGSNFCGYNKYTCCSVVSTHVQSNFSIRQYINCKPRNIIYYFLYIMPFIVRWPYTSQPLKNHYSKHLSDVPFPAERNMSAASSHFANKHAGDISCCQVQGIKRVTPPLRGGFFFLKTHKL